MLNPSGESFWSRKQKPYRTAGKTPHISGPGGCQQHIRTFDVWGPPQRWFPFCHILRAKTVGRSWLILGCGTTQARDLQSRSTPEETSTACTNTPACTRDVNAAKASLICNGYRGPKLANLALLLLKLPLQRAHLLHSSTVITSCSSANARTLPMVKKPFRQAPVFFPHGCPASQKSINTTSSL